MNSNTAIQAWLDDHSEPAAQWLFETHAPMLRRIVCLRVPSQDMIDDIIQETFVKAFKAMPRLQSDTRIEAWLATIARHACSNAQRAWRRRIVRPATECAIDDLSHMLIVLPSEPTMDHAALVDHLFTRLNVQDRQLLQCLHLEGCTAREAGQRFGLSEGNVRVRASRCLRSLRAEACVLRECYT